MKPTLILGFWTKQSGRVVYSKCANKSFVLFHHLCILEPCKYEKQPHIFSGSSGSRALICIIFARISIETALLTRYSSSDGETALYTLAYLKNSWMPNSVQ